MRIGVISDIHGNLVGLRAVLDWLDRAGVDQVVCAGDVPNFGPRPNGVISLLAERGIACAQGNCDEAMLRPFEVGQHAGERTAQLHEINDWCRANLTPTSLQWLAALQPRLHPAPGLLILHGGLTDLCEIVDENANPEFPDGITAVAAGHLHAPFINRAERGLWVNAGSAGRSTDGDPRAALAILEDGPGGWEVRRENRRLAELAGGYGHG